MRMCWNAALVAAIGISASACGPARTSLVHERDEPPPAEVSLCGLLDRAEATGMWGQEVRVRGVYLTDFHEFEYVMERCLDNTNSFISLSYDPDGMEFPGLDPMGPEIRRHCRNKFLCTVEARITIDGTLVADSNNNFGLQLIPTRVAEFSIVAEE